MSVTANFAGPVQTGAINRFRMLQSMARVHLSGAAQSIANNAATAISFDTADVNTDGLWAAGSPTRLTAAIAGKYIVIAGVFWAANATGQRSIILVKNGTTNYGQTAFDAVSTNLPLQTTSDLIPMAGGDYVEARAYQTSGAALNANNDNRTFFAMVYVGE